MKAELSRRGLLALGTAALSVGRASGAGNTLVYGMNTNPGTLRPFEQGGLAGTAIKMMTQRTLTTYTPDGKIVPCLAASWSQPTPTQFVFHLRPDAKFHNGDAVTADDVLYGFNEILKPQSTAFMKPDFQVIDSVKALDPTTVQFNLKNPSATFLDLVSQPNAPVVSAKSAGADPQEPIGAGPYRITSRERGYSISMERFPQYFEAGKPHFPAVKAIVYADENARVAALQAGDADIIELVPWQSVAMLKKDPHIKLYSQVGGFMYLQFNFTQGLFTNPKLRQAMAYAVNRQAIVESVFYGQGSVLDTLPILEGPLFHPDAADRWSHDPDRAKHLIAEAGYPNGFSTKILALTAPAMHLRTAELVQQDLAKIGVQSDLVTADYGRRTAMGDRGQYEFAVYGAGGFFNDPDGITSMIGTGPASYLRSYGFSSKKIDDLLRAGREELDPAKRAATYAMLQHVAMEEVPIVGLNWRQQIFGVRSDLQGFQIYDGFLSTLSTATIADMTRTVQGG